MGNLNVIDFFSRQTHEKLVKKDSSSMDEWTEKYGVYLGCLMEQDTKVFRNFTAILEFKMQQINYLTMEWESLYSEQQSFLQYCIDFLKVPKAENINLEKDILSVSKGGHTWIIYDFEAIKKK
ncbi:hypothetical protein [Psychrobacillus sp. L4]|uniref:hypothetical protein n=1 Tax=Psychrobacillus sp. L4 TaxID=3236892 RepID=UPI0036F3C30E